MLDGSLSPLSEERLLCDDEQLLAVDKPAGLPIHGGDSRRPDDLVSRLRTWLEWTGRGGHLGVHQRLDAGASGVQAFTRDPSVDGDVGRELREHSAGRVYVAAVRDPGLAPRGTFRDRVEVTRDGTARVVAAGGKPAVTRYEVLARNRSDGRALLELRTETGRTHQIRVQLAHRGAPIAGDRSYGGEPELRLMLHARELSLRSLRRTLVAPVPRDLERWAAGAEPVLGFGDELAGKIRDALCRRFPIAGKGDVHRLVDGGGDLLPGVRVERYADWVTLTVETTAALAVRDDLAGLLVEHGARGVYLKDRSRPGGAGPCPGEPIAGVAAPVPLVVTENDLRIEVDLARGASTGLFVDQRDNRRLLRDLSAGRRVLNLFCHTGSFTVAAAAGGASESVSVDVMKSALDRARRNLELNGLAAPKHRLLRADAVQWAARARRRGERFDVVVLDPPTFAGGRRPFSMSRHFVGVARDAVEMLRPGGRLLAVVNRRTTSRGRLRRLVHEAARAAGRTEAQLKDLAPPPDCAVWNDGTELVKAVLLTLS